ncbi:MAG TPA: aminotransferase class V-fold PLP-dependent enzyme [Candidatus Limnocylindria bacterium]|nr:aminotransferase class V-fold PLP-dependent enzyme [Candidatus Limnocylindria bacterium]
MTSMREQTGLDVAALRDHFPALARADDGVPVAYLDGPGGTQVTRECIAAMTAYLERSNANHGGAFAASVETDALLDEVHAAGADFLGAHDPHEIAFGPNMTTLTLAVSRAIGRDLQPGDEIVVTRLDHDANVAPWLAMAEDRGLIVRWLELDEEAAALDLDRLDEALTERTKVVAIGLASNALGTVTDVGRVVEAAHAVGAIVHVDAVHAAPHMPIDVSALQADLLVCSPYKFFAPHLGMLYGRRDLLERLGAAYGDAAGRDDRRGRFRAAMSAIHAHEREMSIAALERLATVSGLHLFGITEPSRVSERVPTFSFTLAGHHPRAIAEHLAQHSISAWDGDFYAWELVRALGLDGSGGLLRIGLVHYNTLDEIDRLVAALGELTA